LSPFSVVPYTTQFYFPEAGSFSFYPANVSKNGKIVAKADTTDTMNAKNKLTEVKL